MYQLYQGDYRVRIYIANCLNDAASAFEKTSESVLPLDDILIQTALCFEIGFGVARDQQKSYNLIKRRKSNEVELARQLKHLCENGVKRHFSNRIYRLGEREGCVQYIDLISTCGGRTGWERVQSQYRGEISDASQALGCENVLVLLLKDQIARGYTGLGRWHEAEQMQLEILQARERTLGAEDIQTLYSKGALAEIHRNQSRFQEAQELQMQIQETMTAWNTADPFHYSNAHNLALTYADQEQWEKSDKLLESVIHHRNFHNGPNHPSTLNSRLCLARNYADRGEWELAEEIETDVLHITERTQGPEHPDTFVCIINLATTYRDMGQLAKAENLQVAVLQKARLVLGPEHYFTVTLIGNLAKTYSLQSQMPKAIKLQEEVVNLMRLQAQMDPQTPIAIKDLAEMYEANGQLDDAIRRRKQRLAMLKDSSRFEYVENIVEMALLADLYWTQDCHNEAFELMQAALEELKKAEEDEDPEVIEDLMICITQRRVKKPNGDQDATIIDLIDIVQEWSDAEVIDLTNMFRIVDRYPHL